MNKKYLILGNGWLGNILKEYLGPDAIIWDFNINNITDINIPVDVVINTAAKTNIDWCEKNKIEAFKSNVLGALNVAKVCKYKNIKHVFISSACIFESQDKNDIKYEDSKPNPQCFYAETKVMAEQLILEANPDTLIPRLRLPLSEVPHPRNTIDKLLTYDRINDSQESVTIIEDMLPVLKMLIEKNEKGIFHLINDGLISPADIVSYFEHEFEMVSKKEQDKRLAKEGRAKRVTTYADSKRMPLLPNVHIRMPLLAKKYKSYVK